MKPPFLAPKIVEMITAGKQPPDLTAEALAERIHLPLLWTEQEQAGRCELIA
jgi:site-specific DNA recombinase